MRIVSLNLWGGRSSQHLDSWIADTNADIYCFQEVFSSPIYGNFLLEDTDGHVVETDLLTRLKNTLTQHTCFFSPGSRGYVNDSTWVGLEIEYGIAIFVRSDWAVSANLTDIVHGPFRCKEEGHPPLSRSAQVIRCRTPTGSIVVGNIHGLWDPLGKHDTEQRMAQAEKFAKLIGRVAMPYDPLILCGDFNVLPDSLTFAKMHTGKLKNLIKDYGVTSTRSIHYTKSIRFADYIFVNDKLNVDQFFVPQDLVISDHCPVILDAQLKVSKSKTEIQTNLFTNSQELV